MNLKERLATGLAETKRSPSHLQEQMLLSKVEEMKSVIAALQEELTETQKIILKLTEEKEDLEAENENLTNKIAYQAQVHQSETEQTIRDLEDEIGKLRELVDISNVTEVRRAHMKALIIQRGAAKEKERYKEEAEERLRRMGADCRRKIAIAREETEKAKRIAKVSLGSIVIFIIIVLVKALLI